MPATGCELRGFLTHPLEHGVDIVAALAGVFVADAAEVGEDFVFAHGSRFINSTGVAMTGQAHPAAAHARSMRRKVKRLLRKHGYPPDKQEKAVVVVIEQAERVCKDWARVA